MLSTRQVLSYLSRKKKDDTLGFFCSFNVWSFLYWSTHRDVKLYFGQDIGGCDIQKQEIREAVELPLTHHELYKQIGIDPPRGVLLYGPPGTGKTMLAKAVANHTTAAFIRVVGSEFVQKYLGEVIMEIHFFNVFVIVYACQCTLLLFCPLSSIYLSFELSGTTNGAWCFPFG